MNMKQENRVTEVMNSLEGIEKAKAPRDGFAKIQQKLADQRKQQQQPARQQPGYGWLKIAAVITLVLSSNIWAVTGFLTSEDISNQSGSYPQIVSDFNLYGNE